jgi:hypothetical protein
VNDYFNHDTNRFAKLTKARAEQVNAVLDELVIGLNKLPGENENNYSTRNYIATDTGAVNAYAGSLSHVSGAYVEGQEIFIKVASTNTGACTLNVSGIGDILIKHIGGYDLYAGDIQAGYILQARYTGAYWQYLGTSSVATALAQSYAVASAASASDAATSASNALTSETNALASENKAQKWADETWDVEVEAGKYSAKHWATEAENLVTQVVIYRGTWDASGGVYPTSPSTGDYYIISVAGTISGTVYAVGDGMIYNGATWDKIDNTDAVTSVAGRTGAVTLTISDLTDVASLLRSDQDDTFTGNTLTVAGSFNLASTVPRIWFLESGVNTDQGYWRISADQEAFYGRIFSDDFVNNTNWLEIQRSGTGTGIAVDSIDLTAAAINLNGIVSATDYRILGNGYLSAQGDAYFNTDSNNNETGKSFIWGTNRASSTGGTELMRLSDSGLLTLQTNGLVTAILDGATQTHISLWGADSNIAAAADMNFYIDSNNNSTTAVFEWLKDSPNTTGAISLMTLTEAGVLTVGDYATTLGGQINITGTTINKQGIIKCTNGNLHVDADSTAILYLNYYTGSGGINFGNGASGSVGSITNTGNLSISGDMFLGDNRGYTLGTGNDISHFWDGTNYLIDFQTINNSLLIRNVANTNQLQFNVSTGNMIIAGTLTTGVAATASTPTHVWVETGNDSIIKKQTPTNFISNMGLPTLSANNTFTGTNTFNAIPAFNGGTTGVSAPFTVDSTFKVTNLNADLLDGYNSSTAAGNSTVVVRNASGYVYANYFNSTSGTTATTPTNIWIETGSDSFFRKQTPAQFITNLGLPTLSANNTFTGIPAFNGGTSGASAPFTVDSTFVVTNLNADLLDGVNGASYARSDTADTISGVLTFSAIPAFNGGTSGASAPFTVDSNFVVTNLNAQYFNGLQTSQFLRSDTSSTITGNLTATGYFDTGVAATATSPSNVWVETGSDGIIRKQTQANFISNLGLNVVGPVFSAYRTSPDITITTTAAEMIYNIEIYDTASAYNTTTGRFTPNVAGYYLMSYQGTVSGGATQIVTLGFRRNSAFTVTNATSEQSNITSGQLANYGFSAIYYLNGSTDYVSVWALTSTGTASFKFAGIPTFSGTFLRS